MHESPIPPSNPIAHLAPTAALASPARAFQVPASAFHAPVIAHAAPVIVQPAPAAALAQRIQPGASPAAVLRGPPGVDLPQEIRHALRLG